MESGLIHNHDALCRELREQHLFNPTVKNTAGDTEIKQPDGKQPIILLGTNRIGLISPLPIVAAVAPTTPLCIAVKATVVLFKATLIQINDRVLL